MSVALVILYVKRMRRIILSSVACLAVPYFPHYLKKERFSENVTAYKMCVLMFSRNIFEEMSEILSYICTSIHVRYPSFMTDFNETCNFQNMPPPPQKKIQISRKSFLVGAELFHADRRTDRHDGANVRYPSFMTDFNET